MTITKFRKNEIRKEKSVNVWKCNSCEEFHLKAGNVLLTFSKEEFADFVNDTWNCFYDKEFKLSLAN